MVKRSAHRPDGEHAVVLPVDAVPIYGPAFGQLEVPSGRLGVTPLRSRSIQYPPPGGHVFYRVDVGRACLAQLTDVRGALVASVPLVEGWNVIEIRREDLDRPLDHSVREYLHIDDHAAEVPEDVPAGAYAYAIGPADAARLAEWSIEHEAVVRSRARTWTSDGAQEAGVDVYLDGLDRPLDAWLDLFEAILRPPMQLGATVAWLGAEDCSPYPGILRPAGESGGVLAAYATDLGLVCRLSDPSEVTWLDDADLAPLWAIACATMPDLADDP